MSDALAPIRLLEAGVGSWLPQVQPDGTLHDPVFDCPTQYGTAHLAWCGAVLAEQTGEPWYGDLADEALRAALTHTADPSAEPYASGFDRRTLSVTGRLNHRDFTWPPILKTAAELGLLADPEVGGRIAGVSVEESFRARPPSNWAAVWMSGEWRRIRAGLSSTTSAEFDDWLDVFFAGGEVGFDLELGLYVERGLPNAYDLFTRVHLTDLLLQGFDGRNRDRLETFLITGLRRSLALQLSDGSVASGYRSTGQTWVLGAQIALFTAARSLGWGTAAEQDAGRLAAWRAYGALGRCARSSGVFSPVQNVLPPELRVGYENYTADGHYAPLALSFLADAVRAGFGDEEPPTVGELDGRSFLVRPEGRPTHRGTAHRGRISMGVQAAADDSYDARGLVDLTFGADRSLVFVSAARHVSGGPWLVPGLALRDRTGAAPVRPLGAEPGRLTGALQQVDDLGLTFQTTVADDLQHRWSATLTADGVDVVETVSGWSAYRTLLIPYLRDRGDGMITTVTWSGESVRLARGEQWVEITVDGSVERLSDLADGYENRRGRCGLVRLDLLDPGESLRWSVRSGPAEVAQT